jgi:hypothetical protein
LFENIKRPPFWLFSSRRWSLYKKGLYVAREKVAAVAFDPALTERKKIFHD